MTSVVIVDDEEDIVDSLQEILELNDIQILGKGW